VQQILKDVAHRYHHALIVLTHYRDLAAAADRVIVMSDGRSAAST
jgi:ABC-type lipoprotein export system ATPase subunit